MKVNYEFIIIGTGGTGGNFIKEFARFVSCLDAEEQKKLQITLVDGDIVEDKNRSRQPFISDDINKSKAFVLAEAIGENFGLTVHAVNQYITQKSQLDGIWKATKKYFRSNEYIGNTHMPVLIGCVDNHRARQVMEEFFQSSRHCIYIDSANEYSVGEVVCGSRINNQQVSPPRSYYYPDIMYDSSPNKLEESCQQINSSSPQHLVTNIMAANIVLKECVDLLKNNTVPTGIIYFDAFQCFMKKRVQKKTEDSKC